MVKKKSRAITVSDVKASIGYMIASIISFIFTYGSWCVGYLLGDFSISFTTAIGMFIMIIILMISIALGIICLIFSMNRIFGEELIKW